MSDSISKSETHKNELIQKAGKNIRRYKLINKIIAVTAFTILRALLIIMISYINNKDAVDRNGCTLPGATEIYPAVMYDNNIYYWKRMAVI